MDHINRVVLQFLVFTALSLAAKTVVACVCTDKDDTVLGRFEDARFVIIARVLAIEKISDPDTTRTRMVIEKVYKGNLRVGQEMMFGQGESGSCIEDFDERDMGARFLFYLKPKEMTPSVWYADGCEKSKPLPGSNTHLVNDSADDLSYLEKIDKVTGKTRISGTLISYQWSPTRGGADFKKVVAIKVRLIGREKIYETETNENGVYEIYDLPAGRYTVEPNTPKGWAIEKDSPFGREGSSSRKDSEHFQVVLEKGRHAYFDFFFMVDSKIRGRVLNRFGSPMSHVCVNLIPTEGKVSEYFKRIDCTEGEGVFEIDEIPFGSYFIVVNNDDKITAYQPFRRFYYPNVYEREKAQVVTFVEGDDAKAIDIYVPEMREVVDIEGLFLTADRKPVTRARIFFKAEKTDELTDGDAFAVTDANGKFSLKVLKGLKGKLSGQVWLEENQFTECPQVVALLKTNGETGWDEQKTEIEIQSHGNVNNMELKLPFPSCKGRKIVSRVKID